MNIGQLKRGGCMAFLRCLVGFALVDYATGIAVGALYAPPKGAVDFLLTHVLYQAIAASVGVVPLAAVSSGLWLLVKDRIGSPAWLGIAVGVGSLGFIFTWVNFILGVPPAPQSSQVLAASLGIASGAYAAWMGRRASAKSAK